MPQETILLRKHCFTGLKQKKILKDQVSGSLKAFKNDRSVIINLNWTLPTTLRILNTYKCFRQ